MFATSTFVCLAMEINENKSSGKAISEIRRNADPDVYTSNVCLETPQSPQDTSVHMVVSLHCIFPFLFFCSWL